MNPATEAVGRSWMELLLDTMVNADRSGAAAMTKQALAEGLTSEQVIVDVLNPALVKLGALWGRQSISLAQTFVAAKIAEDVLLRCLPSAGMATAPTPGVVVIGNIEDDFHSLGRRIVVAFLRAAGWQVHDLGNDVPPERFVETAVEAGAAVVAVSAMMQTTALNIRKLRQLIDARGLQGRLKLAVGGAVFGWRPELAAEVGGDGTADNASGVDALLRRLQSEARQEHPL